MRYLLQEEKEKMQELITTKKEVAYKDICIHLGWEVLVGSHRVTRLKLLKDSYEMQEIRGDRPNDLKYIIIREKENSESKRGRRLDTQKEIQKKKKIREQKKLEKQKLEEEKSKRRIVREQKRAEKEIKKQEKEQKKLEKEIQQQKLEKQKKIKETMKMREEYKKIGKLEKSYIVDHLINKRFAKYIDKIILDTLIENKGQYTSSFIHMYKKLIRIDMYHLNYLMQKEVIKDIEKYSIITYNDIKNFTFDVSMTMNKICECALCRLHKRDFINYDFNFYIKRDIEVDKNKKQFDFDFTNEELILITDIETRNKIIEIEDKNKKFYKDLQVLKNFEKYKNDVINDIDTQGIVHKYTTDKIKSYFKVVILTQRQYNREYRVNENTLREYKNNLRDEIIRCITSSIEKMSKEYIITDIQKSIKLDLLQILINGEVDVEMLIEKYKRK